MPDGKSYIAKTTVKFDDPYLPPPKKKKLEAQNCIFSVGFSTNSTFNGEYLTKQAIDNGIEKLRHFSKMS